MYLFTFSLFELVKIGTGIVLDDYELQNTYSTNLGRSDFDLYQAAIGKAVNRA